MKRIVIGAFIGLLTVILMINMAAETKGAPILTYVYSNSMEPLIKVNDAFLIWPEKKFEPGDIVMYRPVVLQASYITHRIIAAAPDGFITKGDNSPYPDQGGGEPAVTADRIVGKVLTVNGRPIILPGLGYLTSRVRLEFGKYTKYLAAVFLVLGLLSMAAGSRHRSRRRKSRQRWRLKHLYRGIGILAAVFLIISIYAGSRVSQVKYLVSEYPGSRGDQILVGQSGNLILKITNNGLFPVWTITNGIAPLSTQKAPLYLNPRSAKTVILNILPVYETGSYQGYVQVFNYPAVLPKAWIVCLHEINPVLAALAEGLSLFLCFALIFRILNHIHGLEDWIPLRTLRDKIITRRIRRIKARVIGQSGRRKVKF